MRDFMKREEFLKQVSDTSGVPEREVTQVYEAMTACIIRSLSEGDDVVLLPELGSFVPKLNDNTARNEHSPRTPRDAVYKIRFRPGKAMEQKLKVEKSI